MIIAFLLVILLGLANISMILSTGTARMIMSVLGEISSKVENRLSKIFKPLAFFKVSLFVSTPTIKLSLL